MKGLSTSLLLFITGIIIGAVWFKSCAMHEVTISNGKDSVLVRKEVVVQNVPRDTIYEQHWRLVHSTDTAIVHDTVGGIAKRDTHLHDGRLIAASPRLLLPDSAFLRMLYYDRELPFEYQYQAPPEHVRYEQIERIKQIHPAVTHGVTMGFTMGPDKIVRPSIGYGFMVVIGEVF